MSTRLDPLEYLEREDKWYLGGGRAAMFAPAFPRWLDRFGFWDEAYFADVRLERLFTVLVLDEDERPLTLQRENRRWTPDALTQIHVTSDGLRIREDKVVTEHDTLASRISIYNEGKRNRTLQLILWSLQAKTELNPEVKGTSAEAVSKAGEYLTFAHTVEYGESPYSDRPAESAAWGERAAETSPERPKQELFVALGADRAPVSSCILLAEPADTSPLWQVSIVPEKFSDGRFHQSTQRPNNPTTQEPSTSTIPRILNAQHPTPSHLHLCLHYSLEIPSGESRSIQLGASLNLDRERGLHYIQNDLQKDVAAASRKSWHDYFAGVPYFECSDPYLQKYYWYRWYGVRLLTVDLRDQGVERFPHPCVFEGIGGFRSHISYSAQCHMLETGWKHDPSLAFGSLEGMLASQENSGFIPGHIYLWREDRGFYHANWGANALQAYHITGDRSFIDRVYPGLSRYADYFERERDREDSHLYDIVDQGETGQEYMSRYLFVDEGADDWRRIQLKGVDSTVYVYQLQRALSEMASIVGKETESRVWTRKADLTGQAVREKMWDPERGFFFDVDPRTGRRSPYKAAVGIYPFLCDIAGPEHLAAISDHLLNPAEFWTPWPVPASSVDDPYYSSEAEWKGIRMSCPWNGRVWPMTNSHVAEALAHASQTLDPSLAVHASRFIHSFIKLMFFDQNPKRPNCFEHYNPINGTPSLYRGVDDYQHSWVVDLLIKYLIGLQPSGTDELVFDPLPFEVSQFKMSGIHYRGRSIDVTWDEKTGYAISVNGEERIREKSRKRISVRI
jgi:hypothetical protein